MSHYYDWLIALSHCCDWLIALSQANQKASVLNVTLNNETETEMETETKHKYQRIAVISIYQ